VAPSPVLSENCVAGNGGYNDGVNGFVIRLAAWADGQENSRWLTPSDKRGRLFAQSRSDAEVFPTEKMANQAIEELGEIESAIPIRFMIEPSR
jgi:hypothetical protein